MIQRRSFVAGTAAALTLPSIAFGQSGQIRLVVPYGPGGSTDTAGRVLAERMSATPARTSWSRTGRAAARWSAW